MGTPNLFSVSPVVIFAWVRASTSGLTRSAQRARRPSPTATSDSAAASSALSMLSWRMSASSAARISARVLPTPEKTMPEAGTPAARAARSSPSLTTSAPRPSRARVWTTAMLGLALVAKCSVASSPAPRIAAASARARRRSVLVEYTQAGVPISAAMRASGTSSSISPARGSMVSAGRWARRSPKEGSSSEVGAARAARAARAGVAGIGPP